MDTVAKCIRLNYSVKYILVKKFKSFGTPRFAKNDKTKKTLYYYSLLMRLIT